MAWGNGNPRSTNQSITPLPNYLITRFTDSDMRPFAEALKERVLVCDGAMGTMLYSRGVFINKSFDAMNLTQPELVEDVHREYVRAGADVIETNTFGANRIKLGSFGLADRLKEVNIAGVRIARRAGGDRAYVAGSIGPLGIR